MALPRGQLACASTEQRASGSTGAAIAGQLRTGRGAQVAVCQQRMCGASASENSFATADTIRQPPPRIYDFSKGLL